MPGDNLTAGGVDLLEFALVVLVVDPYCLAVGLKDSGDDDRGTFVQDIHDFRGESILPVIGLDGVEEGTILLAVVAGSNILGDSEDRVLFPTTGGADLGIGGDVADQHDGRGHWLSLSRPCDCRGRPPRTHLLVRGRHAQLA